MPVAGAKNIIICTIFSFYFMFLNITLDKKWIFPHFFSKSDQIRRKLRIWSHLLKKSLMENFIFCAVLVIVSLFKLEKLYRFKYYHTVLKIVLECLNFVHLNVS